MKIYLVGSNHHAILSHEDWSQIALEIFYVKIQEIWLVVRILIHEKKIHIDGLDFRQKSQNLIFFFFYGLLTRYDFFKWTESVSPI